MPIKFLKPSVKQLSLLLITISSALITGTTQAADNKAIYVGREQPSRVIYDTHPYYSSDGYSQQGYAQNSQYRVINRSYGYEPPPMISGSIRGNHASAQFNYYAPSTTTINRSVQIIPPQNGNVGDISYSLDQYYIYPDNPYPRYQHPRRRYYPQRVVPVIDDPQATENRSKQWTDKSDFQP